MTPTEVRMGSVSRTWGSRLRFKGREITGRGKALMLSVALLLVSTQDGGSEATRESSSPVPPTCTRPGQVWWNELLASDADKLADFYADVIGWTIKGADPSNTKLPARSTEDRYVLFTDGSQEMAGLIKSGHRDAAHSGVGWFVYIQVQDVDKAVFKVQDKGGTLVRPAITTAEGDRIAVVSDPLGNVFGLVTPANPGCQPPSPAEAK